MKKTWFTNYYVPLFNLQPSDQSFHDKTFTSVTPDWYFCSNVKETLTASNGRAPKSKLSSPTLFSRFPITQHNFFGINIMMDS